MEISRLLLFVPEQPYLYAMPLAGPVRVGRGGTTALSKRSLNYWTKRLRRGSGERFFVLASLVVCPH